MLKDWKNIGELIHHFVTAGDESSLQASHGQLMVYGCHDQKKQEKKLHDSHESMMMYHTGNVAGNTGPTAFVMKGEHHREGLYK